MHQSTKENSSTSPTRVNHPLASSFFIHHQTTEKRGIPSFTLALQCNHYATLLIRQLVSKGRAVSQWLTIVWNIQWADAADVCNEALQHLGATSTKGAHGQVQLQILDICVEAQPNKHETTHTTSSAVTQRPYTWQIATEDMYWLIQVCTKHCSAYTVDECIHCHKGWQKVALWLFGKLPYTFVIVNIQGVKEKIKQVKWLTVDFKSFTEKDRVETLDYHADLLKWEMRTAH